MIQLHHFLIFFLFSCSGSDTSELPQRKFAEITKVTASGAENNYRFSVTISSPDTGCDQYADWWEVVSESGELIYRRILLHSHVNEQPFTRSGGSVQISEDQVVWVRAHMNNSGYGGQAMKGSVTDGFEIAEFPENIGSELEQEEPLPNGCNF